MNNSCGRCEPEFKKKIEDKLNYWFGGKDQYKILYQWFDQNTSNNVIMTEDNCHDKTLYFIRIFSIGKEDGSVEISQDGKEMI